MKTPSLALLNSIGFTNYAQKALYAAHVLKAATIPSPQVQISPAVAPVPGKRAVAGYAGFPGSAAQTAAQNTTGKLAGEVFPGRPAVVLVAPSNGYAGVAAIPAIAPSPAYPAGTAIPLYPAVAARAAVVETAPVPAKAAVIAPAVVPLAGHSDAIAIKDLYNGDFEITAYLPKATSPALIGSTAQKHLEITPTNATPLLWIGEKASNTPTAVTTVPETLEEYFLANAINAIDSATGAGSLTTEDRSLGGTLKTCTKVVVRFSTQGRNFANPDLQLNTVNYYVQPPNNGGNGTEFNFTVGSLN